MAGNSRRADKIKNTKNYKNYKNIKRPLARRGFLCYFINVAAASGIVVVTLIII